MVRSSAQRAAWLVAAALAPFQLAHAQSFETPLERRALDAVLPPSASSPGRAEAAQLTPDLRRELAVLVNGRLVVSFGTGTQDSAATVATGVLDFAVLPGGAPDGSDALVAVDASGLKRWWVDVPNQTFVSSNLGGSGWAGATRLRATDANGDGVFDIAGLCADAHTLRYLYSPLGTPSESSTYHTPTVYDFELLDWDFGVQREVALLGSTGLTITRTTGAVLATIGAGVAGDTLVRRRQVAGSYDGIALFTHVSGVDYLITASREGTQATVNLGALDVVGALAADANGDGNFDLVVSRRAARGVRVYTHTGNSSAPYSAASSFDLTHSGAGTPPNNIAWPVAADFDEDSDLDLALATSERRALWVWKNTAISAETRMVGSSAQSYTWNSATNKGTLALNVTPPSVSTFTPTHVELTVWAHASSSQPAGAEAVLHRYVPVSWSEGSQTIAFDVDDRVTESPVYTTTLRAVVLDTNTDRVTNAGPVRCGAVVYSDLALTELSSIHGVVAEVENSFANVGYPVNGLPGFQLKDSETVVAYLALGDMPDFEPEKVPEPHDDKEEPFPVPN